MDDFPRTPRIVAGLGALLAVAYLILYQPQRLIATGHPLTAEVMAATAVPFVAFLAWIALSPASLQPLLRRASRADLHDAGHVAALLILAATLYYVIGFGSLAGGAFAYETQGSAEAAAPMDEAALLAGLVANVFLLVLPVLFYVSFVHGLGPIGALRSLGLRLAGAPRALIWGAATAILAIVLILVVGTIVQRAGVAIPENERALGIAKSVTIAGALAIAVLSAISEEIFFRGFLQPRIALVGQAILFSLAHLSYVNVTESIVTFALALAFGILYKRVGNLWAPIAAHFTFNLLMLLAGMYATGAK